MLWLFLSCKLGITELLLFWMCCPRGNRCRMSFVCVTDNTTIRAGKLLLAGFFTAVQCGDPFCSSALLMHVSIRADVNRKCWCFTTKGMHAVGQSEIVILLQCLPDEKCLPKDIFNHFVQLYRDALAGRNALC